MTLTTTGRQNIRVRIVAGGRVTGGGTANYTPKLYFGTSTEPSTFALVAGGLALILFRRKREYN